MNRKTGKNGFHESYYDHACLIVTERDILDINIPGVTAFSTLRRLWHDLFLLSYTDERAGDYYHSTHAMRMGRARHFQKHRGSIHPMSKFRNFWDMFMLHIFILRQFLLYMNTTVILPRVPNIMCYTAVLIEVFIILDIFINARTGFIDKLSRKVVLDKRRVLINYCSRKLFFHAASAIPLTFILNLRYGNMINSTISRANYFNCVISFLTIISLIRVFKLSSYWKRDRASFKATVFFHCLRIGVIITLITIQLIHYSDTISLIHVMKSGSKSAPTHDSSFFDNLFTLIHIVKANITNMAYVNAHFWRIVFFLGQPRFSLFNGTSKYTFAIIYPHPLMKFIAYGMIMVTTSWLVVEIFYFVTCEKSFDDEIHKSEEYLLNLVKARQLPEQCHTQIKKYFTFHATKIRVMEFKNGLNKCLLKYLNHEIAWQSFSRYIFRIPYFSDWPKEVVEQIVVVIKEHIYLENDLIAEAGVPGVGLMIVDIGVLAVYSPQYEEMGHLIDGDYFGEISLVTDREVITTSVVAVTKCKVLLVEKILFRQKMRNYPDLFYTLRKELLNDLKSKQSSVDANQSDHKSLIKIDGANENRKPSKL